MTKKLVMIIGATSDMALAVSYEFARRDFDLHVCARDLEELYAVQSDISIRFKVNVFMDQLDILDHDAVSKFVEGLRIVPDIVICAVGYMGNQITSQINMTEASLVMRTNFEAPAVLMSLFAEKFCERRSGCLVGISSVAGQRGRASNYVYGAAKAGFTTYLSGLRNRLSEHGVHVVTVLPGFTNTKMTRNYNMPRGLTAEPHQVATAIYYAVTKKRDIVYHKPIWRLIMIIIALIPERIFKKLKL